MNANDLKKFEEDIKAIYNEGKITAPIHLSGGNEAQLIQIFKQIRPDDWVFVTHRSHYHALLHGIDPEWLKKEIVEGRSIHIMNAEHHFVTSAIVGGCLPIAVGVAMAILSFSLNQPSQHVWVFVGDMAATTGVFHECTQYAAKQGLPITFVVEDNGMSTNSPTDFVWGIEPGEPHIIRYKFERTQPHIGSGTWIAFS